MAKRFIAEGVAPMALSDRRVFQCFRKGKLIISLAL